MASELTREQWESLATFAGHESVHIWGTRGDENIAIMPECRRWNPHNEWRDFGPLWVKLERWIDSNTYWNEFLLDSNDFPDEEIEHQLYMLRSKFAGEKTSGTEQELMHAGCLLGAAIGATMKGETA